MGKISWTEIEGKKYPMSFSVGAQKHLAQKVGSLEKFAKAFTGADAKTYDNLTYIVSVVIQQGVAYMNTFGKNLPVEEGAAYENGKYIAITQEELELVIDDLSVLMGAMQTCMGLSAETEVEIEPKKKKAPKVKPE